MFFMKFFLLNSAQSPSGPLLQLEKQYLQMLSRWGHFAEISINSNKFKSLPPKDLIKKEGLLFLKKVPPGSCLIALDPIGKPYSSPELAKLIEQTFNSYASISLVIGGPHGLSETVRNSAKHVLSLSNLTFTSQFARIILIEQIYRSLTIIHNFPYHKE